MRHREPDEYQAASIQGGLPTCVFRSKPYHRVITNIDLGNSVTSTVACYRGIIGTVPVAQNVLGTANTLRGEIKVPAGQAFFIQWSAIGASVSDAFARMAWERDDDPTLKSDSAVSRLEWARTVSTASTITADAIPLIEINEVQTAATVNYGRFAVADLPYLAVHFTITAGAGILELLWYREPVGGNSIAYRAIDILASTADGAGTFPNSGPWVEVFVTMTAPPDTVVLQMWQIPSPATVLFSESHNSLLSVNGAAIGAGATLDTDSLRVRWGWGYFMATVESSPSARITLYAVNYAGTLTLIDYFGQSTQKIFEPGHLILLPSSPLRLRVFNADVSARTYYASITMHPGPL